MIVMPIPQVPSEVWVGPEHASKKQVISFLQNQFCKNIKDLSACYKCAICLQISNHQFYNILWLCPENQYKVEQIREVLARLNLRLGKDEQFYFVFTAAHCLNESGANSLLKSIEEPPSGYHFIFLVPRKELLLDTILSRSIVKQVANSGDDLASHELLDIFTGKNKPNAIEFNLILEKHKDLTDQDSRALLDQIYGFWLQASLLKTNNKLVVLQRAQEYPPMPGSSKLFWRNLYMQLS